MGSLIRSITVRFLRRTDALTPRMTIAAAERTAVERSGEESEADPGRCRRIAATGKTRRSAVTAGSEFRLQIPHEQPAGREEHGERRPQDDQPACGSDGPPQRQHRQPRCHVEPTAISTCDIGTRASHAASISIGPADDDANATRRQPPRNSTGKNMRRPDELRDEHLVHRQALRRAAESSPTAARPTPPARSRRAGPAARRSAGWRSTRACLQVEVVGAE